MSLKPKCVNFDEAWHKLSATLESVISGNKVDTTLWNDRFGDIYKLCVAHPEPFADRLYASTRQFLENHVREILKRLMRAREENLLSTYNDYWQEFNHGAEYLHKLYGYLNTHYIKKQKVSEADMNYGGFMFDANEQMVEVGELALESWKRFVLEPIRHTLVEMLLEQIDRDRRKYGITMSPMIIQGIVLSFVEIERFKSRNPLKYYEDIFEVKLLEMTSQYYLQEAMNCVDQCDCHSYVIRALQYMTDENILCKKYLNASSFEKVVREYQLRLVQDHLLFLHNECRVLIQREIREDLGNMYRLLHPLHNGLCVLVQEMENHIRQKCLEAIQSLEVENISQQFVESLLSIHTKYSELISSVLNSDSQFISALDKACTAAINAKPNTRSGVCRAPELLAKYIDSLLRRSVKGMTETEADEKLNSSLRIFTYLSDKDVFSRFHAKLLAKRLIYGLSHSMDAEEVVINRLRQICGYEFTNKLQKMFSDMKLNVDLNNKFSASLTEGQTPVDLGVNFSMLVLQAGAWPITQGGLPTFAIPQELEQCVQKFESYYLRNYTGRKLAWIHNFCQCEVKMNYPKSTYYATMGTFPTGILLQFNSADRLSLRDLQEATMLPEGELRRQTQMLVEGKLIISEEASLATTFRVNMEYNNKRLRFKIMSTQKEIAQESEQTLAAIDEDRKLYLQATIVRIMKARRALKHNLLIQEVIAQSQGRFAPSVSHIKKCIEILIDKQYIERTKDSSDEYSYIA